MATKDELKRYATKEELSEFRGEVTAWLIALERKIDDLTPTIDNLTPKVDNIELLFQRVLRRLPLP